jgi:hypothetical protein
MPRAKRTAREVPNNGVQQRQEKGRQKAQAVKMRRDDGKTADVHPDMVDDYRTGGYEVVQ